MERKGLLIDYEYCTGCHSCEIACQMEHQLPVGQFGIKVAEIGPWKIEEEVWQYAYVPVPTDQCDLCADRVSKDQSPTCVKHCQAAVMKHGNVAELSKELETKTKLVLYSID